MHMRDCHRGHRGEHRFAPRRFGGPFARGFGRAFGGSFGGFGRFVGDGELRLVVLSLLEEAPRHGYDVIKALEERSQGFYSPSPGVVYPTLTYLEETGHAVSAPEGNKRVYSITEDGRTHLSENRRTAEAALERIRWIGERMARARQWFDGPEGAGRDRDVPGVLAEVNEARRALKTAIARRLDATEETQRRVAEVLRKAADEIDALPRDPDDIDL